jgi:hypothetical protein
MREDAHRAYAAVSNSFIASASAESRDRLR